jgi:threonine aldolase
MNRRLFLAGSALPAFSLARASSNPTNTPTVTSKNILFSGDGLSLQPQEYASVLDQIARQNGTNQDVYLKGGAVQQLEETMASILGKECAFFFPTGTLANHIAVRLLVRDKRRVLVQEESHIYRDENDCAEALSGLNLVPLAPGRANFTLQDVTEAVDASAGPPYPMPIGAIAIESPVRRQQGQVFDFEEMKKISAFAREKGVGLHLDGARMFLASAYTRITPVQYASLFDTVYVSLYKYFNAPFGAVLAGSRQLLEPVPLLRRQFGGGLLHAWQSAAVALHYLNGFTDRYQEAVQNGDQLLKLLEQTGAFQVTRLKGGTNIHLLTLLNGNAESFHQKLHDAGIMLAPPKGQAFNLMINESINRRSPEEIAGEFKKALG